MPSSLHRSSVAIFLICSGVGVLAALGVFNSFMGFPVVFSLIGVAFGLSALRRDRETFPFLPWAGLLFLGLAIAIGGWRYQVGLVHERVAELEAKVVAEMVGKSAAVLSGLEPLATDRARLDRAASYASPATIVTFWATWCSPCWKEMAELQELYEQHQEDGLEILAITRFDHPDSDETRAKDRTKNEKFLERRKISYPAAITSEEDNFRGFGVRTIPSTALVDAAGQIVGYSLGIEGARELMAEAVRMLQ